MMNSSFDFQALQERIVAASAQAFQEVSARTGPDALCAFALFSDEGAMTVCPAFATRSFFDEVRQNDPGEFLTFKYATSEWPLETERAKDAFEDICTLVREHVLMLDDKAFTDFQRNLMDTCVASTRRVRDTVLAEQDDDFLVLVTLSDRDEPKKELIRRVKLLNSAAVTAEFEAWTRTW